MAKRSKRPRKSQAKLPELVVVALASDWDQAREYETLLRNNDIRAVISEHQQGALDTEGVAVMVPEDSLDEAHVVIESQDAYDDFYDFALEDEGSEEFDGDLFEDDF